MDSRYYPTPFIIILHSTPVLPNLSAAAHKCAAKAVTVCCGRMSEDKSFQREVSLKLSTLIESISFLHIIHSTLLPLYQIREHFPKCCKFEIWLDKWIFFCK